MTAAARRVGRFYTAARRHPWVLGKVADWKIPLGPYTPAQIAIAVGGGFLLIKTISWWSWMGPVPIVGWLLAIWAVRRPKSRGRAPMQAALGWVLLLWQPKGGRIGGRAARDRAARPLLGGFTIEGAPVLDPAVQTAPSSAARQSAASRAPLTRPAAGRSSVRRHPEPVAPVMPAGPVSGVQQLLALAQQGGGAR
ncbi:hypothetical protein [Streptomyces sp. CdTB01]|uniref:hypothetical protein n=1 Tax=Streptomyces sp. CdTB01 TaxID=1725411 RepID=UPI00073A89CC|nr:hypothetical protein [Streptomyces sp. CdTB01]ALV30728.1 hypothetical protein AS200_00400 [Streptomyces sp. CdTB01]